MVLRLIIYTNCKKINKLISLKKTEEKIIKSTNKFSNKYYFRNIENKWINLLKL